MHWMSNKLLFKRNAFSSFNCATKMWKEGVPEPNLIIMIIILWCCKQHTVERIDVHLGSYLWSRDRKVVSALHLVTFSYSSNLNLIHWSFLLEFPRNCFPFVAFH